LALPSARYPYMASVAATTSCGLTVRLCLFKCIYISLTLALRISMLGRAVLCLL
jgi:hypothetical protein